MSRILDAIWWPLVITTIGLVVALVVGEIGYVLGRRRTEPERDPRKPQTDLLVAALLGLLSLLLAFSFNIVQNRFDQRKQLSIDDANAIGTTYLRAKTLPAPYDERIQALLRDYADQRVGHKTHAELDATVERSATLHTALWAETVAVARANPNSVIVGHFLASMNEMIDVHSSRVTVALIQRMPRAIIWMLSALSVLAIGMVGYRAGLDRTRGRMPTAVLAIGIAGVLSLIAELDRPTSRMFSISDGPMEGVRAMMSSDVRPPAPIARENTTVR